MFYVPILVSLMLILFLFYGLKGMPALVGMLSGNKVLFLDQVNLTQIKSGLYLGNYIVLSTSEERDELSFLFR